MIMGDTALTVDQNGASGTTAVEQAGPPLRNACAEARRILLELAATRFGVTVDQLSVSEGVISVTADPSKTVTYGELIGGKRFNTTMTWNGRYGNSFSVSGVAKPKAVQELKVTGKSVTRDEIPLIATGQWTYVVDVKLPGMAHARSVKPPVAGAKLISVDESSVAGIPGLVKIVTKGNFVAVVYEREENAIRAAERLKVNWENPAQPSFPTSSDLYDYIRNAPTLAENMNAGNQNRGDVDAALASAARVVEATYEYAFQGHISMGPACAVADPSNDQMTVWSGTQKPYALRRGVAAFLDMPMENVRVIWVEGPGSYGRNDAGDVGFEAALVAKEVGRPVRMQGMRHDSTAWDPKGPAAVMRMRGGLDAEGNAVAYEFDSRWASGYQVGSAENAPIDTLVGQMTGARMNRPSTGNTGTPSELYNIPNKRRITRVVALPLVYESPLRVSNLRDPQGPQTTFASESFIDELAAAAKADPVEFRLKHLTNPADNSVARARHMAVVREAAKAYGWDTRPSPKPLGPGPIVTGRGIAYVNRGNPVVAVIAEVEVNLETGYVRVKRFVCAIDCGLVINPDGLLNVVQGNLLHASSRALYEEVKFDQTKVTSVDWLTYPILTHLDAPDKIDAVFVNGDPNPNRPDLPHYGAGEPPTRPVAATIANAIFDATGIRVRRVPLMPALKAALGIAS
jgi:CO/xanthine dehydrogenase Mo-binding subunit